jgi:predicted metal-dependent phosphoesterase TrpH
LILDLHVHSTFSVDSPVRVEQYAERMLELQAQYEIDGFVLMEHDYLIEPETCDLSALSAESGITILAGVEVDTYWGHILVYGLPAELWSQMKTNEYKKQEPIAMVRAAQAAGAVCVPAHPFRGFIGVGARCAELPGVKLLEGINGSNSAAENRAALERARRLGWAMTGGSDAHFLPELGAGLTRFDEPVRTMAELVSALTAGRCSALTLEEARRK